MSANTIYTIHKLGLDTTQTNQQTILMLQPEKKGVMLARKCSIYYDKLYDIYELHQLGATNRKGKYYYDPSVIMQPGLTLQSQEQICKEPISCQICIDFPKKNKRIPIFNKMNQFSSASQHFFQILQPEDLVHQQPPLKQQSSVYYTCKSFSSLI